MGPPMNYANLRSKTSFIVVSAAVSAMLVATDAAAQRRGGGGGGRPGGGGGGGDRWDRACRAGPSCAVAAGTSAAPYRRSAPYRGSYYRPYYRGGYYRPYYGRGYGYGYGPSLLGRLLRGLSVLRLWLRTATRTAYYPPAPYYGYPYRATRTVGTRMRGRTAYPATYGGYGSVQAYAGVRILGAPPNAEVFADGNSVGIVDDFDGTYQRLELTPERTASRFVRLA